jgi:hypothetical protein
MKITTTALLATAFLSFGLPATAQVRYPGYNQMEQVTDLARRIDVVANSILEQAERNNRRPDRQEARALANLDNLADRASEFHDGVNGYRQNPRRTERSFDAMYRAYERTWNSLERINRRPYIERGMVEIGSMLNDLSRYYGRTARNWRFDRDRDGRDDRWEGRRGN